jgi:5-methyltetrahydrofolate--homocysteine methyltransferase
MADYERMKEVILTGRVEEISGLVKRALEQGTKPQDIISQGLIEGMNEVGARFKNGDMFIPEVLVSAKTMHKGMEMLRPLLTQGETRSIGTGTVVLGTVKGDLHDIGKNLVGMMFEGAGFEVIDLGVDQPPEKFVETAREKEARAVAMSALLTTTMGEMAKVIDALKKAGLRDRIKVMVGGAPLNEKFARTIGADGYAPDAGSAVDTLRKLIQGS